MFLNRVNLYWYATDYYNHSLHLIPQIICRCMHPGFGLKELGKFYNVCNHKEIAKDLKIQIIKKMITKYHQVQNRQSWKQLAKANQTFRIILYMVIPKGIAKLEQFALRVEHTFSRQKQLHVISKRANK